MLYLRFEKYIFFSFLKPRGFLCQNVAVVNSNLCVIKKFHLWINWANLKTQISLELNWNCVVCSVWDRFILLNSQKSQIKMSSSSSTASSDAEMEDLKVTAEPQSGTLKKYQVLASESLHFTSLPNSSFVFRVCTTSCLSRLSRCQEYGKLLL